MHLVNDGPKDVLVSPVNKNLCMESYYILVFNRRDFLEKEKTYNKIYLHPGAVLEGCGDINVDIALSDMPV